MDEEKNLGVKIFGKRIGEIPCFRDSYFYGICTGIFGGFSYFMYSSRVKMASHVGFGTFAVSTLSYWAYCRYNLSKNEKSVQMLQEYMAQQVIQDSLKKGEEPPFETV